MEEINLLGRKPVNIFTFTATAMRMSVYWSVLILNPAFYYVIIIFNLIFFEFIKDVGDVCLHLLHRPDDDLISLARLLLYSTL